MTFTLTEQHIKLLQHSNVDEYLSTWETGAAMIDPKRPYGNSNVAGDVITILELPFPEGFDPEEDEIPSMLRKQAMKIHEETPTALQIVLCTGSFTPGEYRKTDPYGSRSWERV